MSLRDEVWNKSGGHCWYCGSKLKAKWHVDHIKPLRRGSSHPTCSDREGFINLAPSCPPCNLLKSVYSVEEFREELSKQVERGLKSSVNFRTADRFGLIEITNTPVKFWFEQQQGETND